MSDCAYENRKADDWKIHANWCANVDQGSSHDVYIAKCRSGVDQYTAVAACQADAGNAHWLEGGTREQVNAFMANKTPSDCTPPRVSPAPPSFQGVNVLPVIGDRRCPVVTGSAMYAHNTLPRSVVATIEQYGKTILREPWLVGTRDYRLEPTQMEFLGCSISPGDILGPRIEFSWGVTRIVDITAIRGTANAAVEAAKEAARKAAEKDKSRVP